jgi:hypothetical protein
MFQIPSQSDLPQLLHFEHIPPTPIRKPRAKPTFRPHSKFTPEEDFKLCQLVGEHGANAWRAIAKFMPNRNSRQCRERWLNYLNPGRNTLPWTEAEDALLERTYEAIGPRWVFMMKVFPNRTDAMIKNRFQVLQRRTQRGFDATVGKEKRGAEGPIEDIFASFGDLKEERERDFLMFCEESFRDEFPF